MGVLLDVQMSVFTNYYIEPNSNNTMKLMQRINDLGKFDFLPSIINRPEVDLVSGMVNTSNSYLSFMTSNRQVKIVCMDDRLDCTVHLDGKYTLEELLDFNCNVIDIIMQEFPIQGNRLAVNVNFRTEQTFNTFEDVYKTKLASAISSPLKYYKGKILRDWSVRTNTRVPVQINESSETLNVITDIILATNTQANKLAFLCHIDINTIGEDTRNRFSKDSLHPFSLKSKKIIDNIIADFKELEENE